MLVHSSTLAWCYSQPLLPSIRPYPSTSQPWGQVSALHTSGSYPQATYTRCAKYTKCALRGQLLDLLVKNRIHASWCDLEPCIPYGHTRARGSAHEILLRIQCSAQLVLKNMGMLENTSSRILGILQFRITRELVSDMVGGATGIS